MTKPLPHDLPGNIGITIAPGRNKGVWKRDLVQDLTRIRDEYNTDILVTLLENRDLRDIKATDLFSQVEALGMESIHFPMRDKWIPADIVPFQDLVVQVVDKVRQGKNVVVHCNGGKGRSGLLVTCCLIYLGIPFGESIERVREARHGTIRNPIQLMYAHHFKRLLWKQWKQSKASVRPSEMGLTHFADSPSKQSETDIEGYMTKK